jgi:two-component system copper resistance phosphate regulon response regulator CusR
VLYSRVMHVMVVEDDARLAAALAKGLEEAGYRVSSCGTAAEAIGMVESDPPDLIVLDIGLPDQSGLAVLGHLRSRGLTTAVIILTARDTVKDRVQGLDQGADDYLVKPFAFDELLARIRALLRRSEPSDSRLLQADTLTLDPVNRHAARDARDLALTSQEFALLQYLLLHAGRPVSRDMITRDVWNIQSRATPLDNVIDVHISHLRAKVDSGADRKLIHTVRGVGFVLKVEP